MTNDHPGERMNMRRLNILNSAIADGSSWLRAMADRSGQRAWHREPGTMPGYGVPVSPGERAGGEQCPQCGESDLRPYGNGSKWACPRVLLHRAVLRRRRTHRAALGQYGTGSADG
jgi:hypothetical protein